MKPDESASKSQLCLLHHVISLDFIHLAMKWVYLHKRMILMLLTFLKENTMVSPPCCEVKGSLQLNNVMVTDVCSYCSCKWSLLGTSHGS